jgi:hypothetical protein
MRAAAALIVVVALAAQSGCKRKPAPAPAEPPRPEVVAQGKAKVGELKKSLVTALTQAMSQGIPAAIAVCNTEAPAIAGRLSAGGAVVGRATRKPRNPSNLAAGWQAEALARFEKAVATGKGLEGASFARRLPDERTAYAEPLVIQELCLACHGTALAPDVTAALAERYPGDQATGYQVGDLRGVAWVELPVAPPVTP